MQYPFQCEAVGCERQFVLNAALGQAPQKARCPLCGSGKTYRVFGGFQIVSKGEKPMDKVLDASKPALSIARNSGITMKQQRDLYSKLIKEKRQLARNAQRLRQGSRRQDGEVRMVGSAPVELFRCAQRTNGRHYWSEDPKKALKEHDLYFGED